MAIQRNVTNAGGGVIKVPGEYRVKVIEATQGLSKKEKPMLTVTFRTKDDSKIRAYFTVGVDSQMDNFKKLIAACGLPAGSKGDALVGKECGVAVDKGNPNPRGGFFMEIVGYGPANDVALQAVAEIASAPDDEVPF